MLSNVADRNLENQQKYNRTESTRHEDTDYVFVLNFSQEPQTISLERPYVLLATGHSVDDTLTLLPVDVLILARRLTE